MILEDLLLAQGGEGEGSGSQPGIANRIQDLEAILNVVRKINTSLVLSDVLELVIDEAIRIGKAERGFLMLADQEGRLTFVIGRNNRGESIQAESFEISSSVLEDVFVTGESLCVESALSDSRFEKRQSVLNLELQTIICSPLHTREEKIGVIYVDSKYIQPIFKANILFLFEILAGQAAIAIKNARLYENLRMTYEELSMANEQIIKFERMAMKGEIAAEVSHELKNLISVVLLNLQKLQINFETISRHEIADLVDSTIKGARTIENFSKNLLTRSRPSAVKLSCDLAKIVRDFSDFIRLLPKYRSTTIVTNIPAKAVMAEVDVDQIQQVLLNLANNAVEAAAEACIEFVLLPDPSACSVSLLVKDSGPGVKPEILERLFVEKITTKKDGHGYGLPICKQLIELHGGQIAVSSAQGEGTTFTITLPTISATAP